MVERRQLILAHSLPANPARRRGGGIDVLVIHLERAEAEHEIDGLAVAHHAFRSARITPIHLLRTGGCLDREGAVGPLGLDQFALGLGVVP